MRHSASAIFEAHFFARRAEAHDESALTCLRVVGIDDRAAFVGLGDAADEILVVFAIDFDFGASGGAFFFTARKTNSC
jgi:hypothetical protein